jgi:hypothetical protein
VQQIYTPQLERYSDRYRKILGKKTFYDEIVKLTMRRGGTYRAGPTRCLRRLTSPSDAHSFHLAPCCLP